MRIWYQFFTSEKNRASSSHVKTIKIRRLSTNPPPLPKKISTFSQFAKSDVNSPHRVEFTKCEICMSTELSDESDNHIFISVQGYLIKTIIIEGSAVL